MQVHRETALACDADAVWARVKTSALLREVCHPLVRFSGVDPPVLPETWTHGSTIKLRSYLFGVIPLGTRRLYFETVDDDQKRIQTRERDPLIKTWDHVIDVIDLGDGFTRYSDTVQINAGMLTVPVYLFAYVFYRHRQRRWRRIALELASNRTT